ncbi:hypothetical protein KAS06_03635 [Candidatus Bathyarchaeota archaeon]|nr:hypothetical protein [Candidatus Bathyarchaeota archaeon]
MTEESESTESASLEKLSIDNPSEFQFHAAYIAYSDAFDNTEKPETREQLNDSIKALQQKQMDYSTFYQTISQYRTEPDQRFRRSSIKTQRKREWRRKAQRRERNKRHKK